MLMLGCMAEQIFGQKYLQVSIVAKGWLNVHSHTNESIYICLPKLLISHILLSGVIFQVSYAQVIKQIGYSCAPIHLINTRTNAVL
jgi:hypothetical protein